MTRNIEHGSPGYDTVASSFGRDTVGQPAVRDVVHTALADAVTQPRLPVMRRVMDRVLGGRTGPETTLTPEQRVDGSLVVAIAYLSRRAAVVPEGPAQDAVTTIAEDYRKIAETRNGGLKDIVTTVLANPDLVHTHLTHADIDNLDTVVASLGAQGSQDVRGETIDEAALDRVRGFNTVFREELQKKKKPR